MTTMRIASPCSENLDAMPRNAAGDYLCSKCDKAVVDLRRAPRKRALAVIASLRARGDGQVCVRVNAKRDGTPVFAADPSPFSRFVGPVALASSLAACSPQMTSERGTTPVAVTDGAADTAPTTNTNAAPPVTTVTTVVAQPPGVRVSNVGLPEVVPVAGGLAFSD